MTSKLRYSHLVDRMSEDKSDAWEIHFQVLARQAMGEKVLALTIGDSDYASAPIAIEAAVAALRAGKTRYSNILGEPETKATLARWYETKSGLATSPDQVALTFGAQNAVFNSLLCLAGAGDEVLVPEPLYVTYPGVAAACGATLVQVPSPAEQNFHLDLDALEAAITARSRAILIASPSNPGGAVLSHAEWTRVGALAEKHNLWVIADEVYCGLVFEGRHVSAAEIPSLRGRCVIIGSLSKSHAMPGWRLGWIIAPPGSDLPAALFKLMLANTSGQAAFLQAGLVAALEEEPLALPGMVESYRTRRDRLAATLANAPGILCRKPEGGMFLLLDVRASGLTPKDFASRLLEEAGVGLLPADGFGPSTAGHLRVNLGVPDAVIDEAGQRILDFTRKLALHQAAT